jgi:hypothetical protein
LSSAVLVKKKHSANNRFAECQALGKQ